MKSAFAEIAKEQGAIYNPSAGRYLRNLIWFSNPLNYEDKNNGPIARPLFYSLDQVVRLRSDPKTSSIRGGDRAY